MLRLGGLVLVAVLLLWLSREDTTVLGVVGLSALVSLWGAVYFAATRSFEGKNPAIWLGGLGFMAGLGTPLVSLGLMALKTGLHSHSAPDYTLDQLGQALWAGGLAIPGGLIGLGAGLYLQSRHSQVGNTTH